MWSFDEQSFFCITIYGYDWCSAFSRQNETGECAILYLSKVKEHDCGTGPRILYLVVTWVYIQKKIIYLGIIPKLPRFRKNQELKKYGEKQYNNHSKHNISRNNRHNNNITSLPHYRRERGGTYTTIYKKT